MMPGLQVEANVTGCARCEGDHEELLFEPFTNGPEDDEFTHWAMCPALDEPILLKVVSEYEEQPGEEVIGEGA